MPSKPSGLLIYSYSFFQKSLFVIIVGDLIDDIHENWFGNHSLLEIHHGYIQWLFPLFEGGGMNFHSDPLHKVILFRWRKIK